jgi:hypothetical protein
MTQSLRNCLLPHKRFPADMCKFKSTVHMYIISFCNFRGRSSHPYVLTTSLCTRICQAHIYNAALAGCMPPLGELCILWRNYKNNSTAKLRENLERNYFSKPHHSIIFCHPLAFPSSCAQKHVFSLSC